jgi:hypothetical protein
MTDLGSLSQLNLFSKSLAKKNGVQYGLARTAQGTRLAVLGEQAGLNSFEGERSEVDGQRLLLAATTPHNANVLRQQLPWLKPQLLGLATSAGMGDRLGLGTPGHVQAVQAVGGKIAPIFAQQSIREMTRTARTPQQVMDDATWGTFQEGWRSGVGADADHQKTTADLDSCIATGFTFFTIDPGEYVNNAAETASLAELRTMADALPQDVQLNASGLLGKSFDIEGQAIVFDEATLLKAGVKYGRAAANVAMMYAHLVAKAGENFELEVSVDETELPTSHAEHLYIASELKRLGVKWVSLAPRYIGRFEKGVDYIGDLAAFEADFAVHAAIARQMGPYKLSLHSGSDKFSIYPIATRQTRGLVHLKTAGTSYLEALRTLATLDTSFFRSIYVFARERYEKDRASYHVSAELERAPSPQSLGDADLPMLLEQFDAREILHVTFGSVLTERNDSGQFKFYDAFMQLLRDNGDAYAATLKTHFVKHLQPFVA